MVHSKEDYKFDLGVKGLKVNNVGKSMLTKGRKTAGL